MTTKGVKRMYKYICLTPLSLSLYNRHRKKASIYFLFFIFPFGFQFFHNFPFSLFFEIFNSFLV